MVAGIVELECTNEYAAPAEGPSTAASTSDSCLSTSAVDKLYKTIHKFGNSKWKRGNVGHHLSPIDLFNQSGSDSNYGACVPLMSTFSTLFHML